MHDLVGIGFGPSNLALAIAIAEHPDPVRARFLERQERFGWHRGMLLDDATMQVSFLKDLATLRNPASSFTFLSYLHDRGRLVDFINHKNLFPLRVEFHDYLEWAADRVDDQVGYGQQVTGIEPVVRDGVVVAFAVQVGSPLSGTTFEPSSIRTRNVVLGTGLVPHVPGGLATSARVWHSHQLLTRVAELGDTRPGRFVVVGAGQSAAEVTAFLHERFAGSEVYGVFSRYGYSPADDSPFANRIFDPAAVDDFYGSSPEVKEMLQDYHGNTNYSVVDADLIEDLYRRAYQEKVLGTERLRLLNVSRVEEVVEEQDGVRAVVHSMLNGERTELRSDVVVFATGYLPPDPYRLLGEVGSFCPPDEAGRVQVHRDYRVVTTPEIQAGIYLQGGTEHTHGISSSLLSNAAVRAGEILDAVVAGRSVRDVGTVLDESLVAGATART